MDDFFVTIPSGTEENNLLNNFYVKYPYPLLKNGTKYDVALTQISFNSNINILSSNETKFQIIYYKYERNTQKLLDSQTFDFNLKERNYSLYGFIHALNRVYPQNIVATLKKDNKFQIKIYKLPDRTSLPSKSEKYQYKMILYTNGKLHEKLGFRHNEYELIAYYYFNNKIIENRNNIRFFVAVGEKINPKLWRDNLSFMYITSNICKHSFVGDKMLKILRIIPMNFTFNNEIYNLNFEHEYFIPVEKDNIQLIRINLLTAANKPYPLTHGSVIIILHFRKRNVININSLT